MRRRWLIAATVACAAACAFDVWATVHTVTHGQWLVLPVNLLGVIGMAVLTLGTAWKAWRA